MRVVLNMYVTFGKRIADVVLAIIGLVILSPLLLLVAIAIKMEDGGSVIFFQTRVGRGLKPFVLYKFRSMPADVPHVPSVATDRIRITRVGALIRRLNIDELPQLFNVLKGDMSIVGPRPALPVQEALLASRVQNGSIRVRPGLTGLAQVNAYDGMPEAEKATFDARYAGRITLMRDLGIVLRTFVYLLKRPPVY